MENEGLRESEKTDHQWQRALRPRTCITEKMAYGNTFGKNVKE